MSYLDDVLNWGLNRYSDFVDGMAEIPLNYARANGFPDTVGYNNAIAHAYMAGLTDLIYNRFISDSLQALKEKNENSIDSWKDEWNNEIGEQVAEYVKLNYPPEEWSDGFRNELKKSIERGDLITDLSDPRIPPDTDGDGYPDPDPNPTWPGPASENPATMTPLPGPDDGTWPMGGFPFPTGDWLPNLGKGLAGAIGDGLAAFAGMVSPLVLDLDGDGIELHSLANSKAFFDLDNDNFHEHTGWVEKDDGLLARDLNSNGRIDDITELFGNATTDGFIHLDTYDTNNDNFITSADTNFASLRVWKDADEDGWTDAGELVTLASLGITSINANYTATNQTQDGHKISSYSTFTMNGASRSIKDVWFQNDQPFTLYELPANYTYNTAVFTLPELHGYGNVPDLWVAMTDDASLRTDVTTLVNANYSTFNFAAFQGNVENILMKWADAETVNPTSRGAYVDARHLVALEHLTGTNFSVSGNPNPNVNTGIALELMWDQIVTQTATRFLGFIPLKPIVDAYEDVFVALDGVQDPENMTQAEVNALLDPILDPAEAAFDAHPLKWAAGLEYDYATDGFTGSLDAVVDALVALEPSGNTAKQDYWFDKLPIIYSVADSQGLTGTQIDTAIAGTHLATLGLTGAQWLSHMFSLGTAANDTMQGANADGFLNLGNEIIIGGRGNDTMKGTSKDDIYVVRTGDGVDIINDDQSFSGASADKLILADIASTAVTVIRNGTNDVDLVLQYGGGNQVTIQKYFDEFNTWEIESIQLTDTTWTLADIKSKVLIPTSGNDYLAGFRTNDTIDGGLGNDTIKGYEGNDSLSGGDGHDLLVAGKGTDTLRGGLGNDTLTGSNASEILDGGDGNDSITGDFGNDTLLGGNGNDTLDGGNYADTLDGGAGIDILTGEIIDIYIGGADSDTMNISPPNSLHKLTINLATQTASYLNTSNNSTGTISISGIESVVISGSANDTVTGSADSNYLDGGSGIDSLSGGDGMDTLIGTRLNADTLDGGAGFDLVSYQTETGYGLAINLATGVMTQSSNTESILNFEAVIGGEKNDTITGGAAAENLNGFKGNDSITAGSGVDTLQGGEGKDTLTGGANNDIFVYTARSHSVGANKDTITDFVHAADLIDLSGLGFTGIQAGAGSGTILGYTTAGGITTIQSATADFAIALTGNITLTAVDFDFV